MATGTTRVRHEVKVNQGRIIRVEQYLGRLEKRIERLEKQNASLKRELPKDKPASGSNKVAQLEKQNKSLKLEIAKLRARVDQGAREAKGTAHSLVRLTALCEPVQALVRSFKQTPGAPFSAWTMWMLSTFRKQGVYRKQIFK
jgi:predicted RNase H-like nuclease (RuvC/YqgF family)